MQKILILLFIVGICSLGAYAQFDPTKGSVTGNFKLDAQSYIPDAKIGADTIAEKMLSNSYMNVIYNYGKFTAGVRFEGYFNTMKGYNQSYDGFGIAYKFATYKGNFVEVTAGNFYEQFGNGLVFRTYEDRDLGYDNAMEGARIKVMPYKGVVLTGIIGKQRNFWEVGEGIVRGVDGVFPLNDIFQGLSESDSRFTIGGSFVSKFQPDNDNSYLLPENVAASSGRILYNYKNFAFNAEYAFKSQDPSSDNMGIYKTGSSFLINSNYSKHGLGVMVQYKWVDNMSFRSDRNAQLNQLSINYLPAISKNHSYAFAAMYPYATNLNGEVGIQTEIFYKLKRGSLLGGKYGTMLSLNFSQVNDIKRDSILVNGQNTYWENGTDGYNTSFLSMSDSLFSRDINFDITKKFSKKVKGIFTYQHMDYNLLAIQGHGYEHDGYVNANTFIADVTYRIKPKHSIRFEGQAMFTKTVDFVTPESKTVKIKQDFGNWAMLLIEYSVSPHWFVAVGDQFNFICSDDETAANTMKYVHNGEDLHRNHYYQMAMGYSKGASRIQLSFGKQRKGILCVGGVCRQVPAAYGFNISVSSTF